MADSNVTAELAQTLAAHTISSRLAQSPYSELPVKWHKTAAGNPPQMEVRNGVCEVYVPDSPRGDISGVADLLKACLAKGGLAEGSPDGSKRIGWYEAPNGPELTKIWKDLAGYSPEFQGANLRGFYLPPANGLNVMGTSFPHGSVGHEMKHIFDGDFHK